MRPFEIERCSETPFDLAVVDAFLAAPIERIHAIHTNAPFGLRLIRAAASWDHRRRSIVAHV